MTVNIERRRLVIGGALGLGALTLPLGRSLVADVLGARGFTHNVASGEPMDRAGAYAVQGRAALFVTAVEGSYVNVVGLPLRLVFRLAGELGHDLLGWI